MSKYTREELSAMEDEELSFVYEELLSKTFPSTKKRPLIIKEILDAQEEAEEVEQEERESEKKKASTKAPITTVRSTLMKPKSPPRSSIATLTKSMKKTSPSVVKTMHPQTISLGIVESDIESEQEEAEEAAKPKRGRPPKKIEKLSLTSSSEEEVKTYEPPQRKRVEQPEEQSREQGSKVDDILEKIKRSAKVSLLNPKASFQKGDVIREKEPESITPVVVSEAKLVSIRLPVHEEAKKSITDFLHEFGFAEEAETIPSPKKVTTPKKKGTVVSVDEELERALTVPSEGEEELLTVRSPKRISVVESVEPEEEQPVKPGKLETRARKSINDILEEEKAKRLQEELRYAKEQQILEEKERELEKRTQQDESIRKKLTRRPAVVKEITEEGEETGVAEEVLYVEPEGEAVVEAAEEAVAEEAEVDEEEELKQSLLRSPAKWKGTALEDIPFTEFKKYKPKKKKPEATEVPKPPSKPSKKKEKLEEIVTEVEEPLPLVIKKTVKKTAVKETVTGPRDVVQSVRETEEEIEEPEELPKSKPPSKPSSKKKKQESVDVLGILQNVDRSRLGSGRGKNLYSLPELKQIVKQLPNVTITGKNKEQLVQILDDLMKENDL